MFDSAGRIALVTGAGQGVGAEVARVLAHHGAIVAVNDIHEARAETVAEQIRSDGGQALAATGDVGQLNSVRDLVSEIAHRVGAVDILINNAGIPAAGIKLEQFADTDPAEWDQLLRINVYGVMHCCHAVIPAMTDKGWGRIVTVSSDSGRTGEAQMAVYAASKAAGSGLTRSLAKELGPSGITCNTLSLGTIATAAMADIEASGMSKHLRRYPVRRLGTPADVAAAVLWLASDEGGWTTGQTIPLNGGFATS